jgi:MoaA/NifB/PqqE/SkfB family radical SAM enzyme
MDLLKLRKKINFKLIEYQKKKKASIVFGYPYWLTIDPSSICNLGCVFCPTGQKRGTRPGKILSFDGFKKILDKLGPYLFHVDFCNWGEPLLNKELAKMISYAKRFNISTKVDTNLNVDLTDDEAKAIVNSGLDRLTVSIDGATHEVYEKYRRGGNLSKVLGNMRLLADKKIELGLQTPHIHWQFLVFKHNEHEIEEARRVYSKYGADSIGFTAPFCSPEWTSTIKEYNMYNTEDKNISFKKSDDVCEWPWDGITINSDASVSPCCSVEESKYDFDNFLSKAFWRIWNGREYRTARKFIKDRVVPANGNRCTICTHIGASNHRKINE